MSQYNKAIICEVTDKKNRIEIDKANLSEESYKNTINDLIAPCEFVGGIGQQTKGYFDLDKKYEDFDDSIDDSVRIMDYKLNIQNAFHEQLDVNIDFNDIYSTQRFEDPDKFSAHFTIDNMRFTPSLLKKFVEESGLKDLGFDASVYDKDRGLHSIYTYTKVKKVSKQEDPKGYKYIKKKQFLPIENAHISKFLASYIEETFYDMDTKFPKIMKREKKTDSSLKKLFNYKDDDQLLLVSKLVLECLSISRAENYDNWIKLGWCLYNIDDRLLDLWIEFSKNSSKYEDGVCEEIWEKSKEGLGIGSLKYWAKLDNKLKYEEIMVNSIDPVIDKSIRSAGAHADVAEVISLYMKDKIVYDTKVKSWFLVNEKTNIWSQDKEGVKIRLILSTHICNLYLKKVQFLNTLELNNEDADKININKDKALKALKIAGLMKNASFKDSIMKELKSWCIRDDFSSKYLDKNYHLFPFDNKVFDLKEKKYRDIEPTDYIMNTTGYNFDSVDDKYIKELEEILKQIQPSREQYDYLIDINTLRLWGRNTHQQFYIYTGGGANGKSVIYNLFRKAFGNFAGKLNPATFTTETKSANSTSELSSVVNCRGVFIEEPDDRQRLSNNIVKEVTGDAPYKSRGLYQESVETIPQFGLFFLCNTIPALQKTEYSIARRLRVLSFDTKFVEHPILSHEKLKDNNLNSKLEDDINYGKAFIHILIQNWINKDLLNKLDTPKSVDDDSCEYLDECNEVKNFLNTYYIKIDNVDKKIKSSDLYNDFKCKYRDTKITTQGFKTAVINEGYMYKAMNNGRYFLHIEQKSIGYESENE